MKQAEFIKIMAALAGVSEKEISIEYPPQIELGDWCVPCFSLAKKFKAFPNDFAEKLSESCVMNEQLQQIISKAEAVGPYVNFKLKSGLLLENAIQCAEKKNWLGSLPKKRIMIEYLGPNTNKPLHLGHLRNVCIGDALANITAACGQTVIKINLINDRGIHICKSMLAWQKWANGATPKSAGAKGDHFVGKWYVRFAQEAEKDAGLNNEAQILLKKWEQGDKETIALWKKMNKWVLNGFEETLKKIKVRFDKYYFESQTYQLGKDIIERGLKQGIFEKNADGSIVYYLPENEFGKSKDGGKKITTLIRSDGTSVYITQDIGTAVLKTQEFNLDSSIIVTASEQVHHFKCLFHILKKLGYAWANENFHLSYGMVNLPSGKMKSREGTVVDTDDLIEEMILRAKEIIKQKHANLSEKEAGKRAEIIGIGAAKFYMLFQSPNKDITYNPEASVSMEGATAPYCQYAAVRAKKIVLKAKEIGLEVPGKIEIKSALGLAEHELAQKLIRLPERIQASAKGMDPSILARHIYEIAVSFNQFYNTAPVIKASLEEINSGDKKLAQSRLLLVDSTLKAITEGLRLLGIETPDEM